MPKVISRQGSSHMQRWGERSGSVYCVLELSSRPSLQDKLVTSQQLLSQTRKISLVLAWDTLCKRPQGSTFSRSKGISHVITELSYPTYPFSWTHFLPPTLSKQGKTTLIPYYRTTVLKEGPGTLARRSSFNYSSRELIFIPTRILGHDHDPAHSCPFNERIMTVTWCNAKLMYALLKVP